MTLAYYTYIIKSEVTKKLYIGQTNNVEARLKRHNKNRIFSTKHRGPWKLIFSRNFATCTESMKFERKLKSYKSRKYLLRTISDPYGVSKLKDR
jgi:putative endonuclease